MDEEIVELPKELTRFVRNPYGGLFGNSVRARVVQEIVANPYRIHHPKELEGMTDSSPPSVRGALNTLIKLGLVIKDSSDKQRPTYEVNLESKKLTALTLLSYAILDDREGTDLMNNAVLEHCVTQLGDSLVNLAVGRFIAFDIRNASGSTRIVAIQSASTNKGVQLSRGASA